MCAWMATVLGEGRLKSVALRQRAGNARGMNLLVSVVTSAAAWFRKVHRELQPPGHLHKLIRLWRSGGTEVHISG